MKSAPYPTLGERVCDLVRRQPGLTTEEIGRDIGRSADVAEIRWLLADNCRQADDGWYLRGTSLAAQQPGRGRESQAVAALECFLSEGPQRVTAIRKWYGRAVPDPPQCALDELLERNFIRGKRGWRVPTRDERRRLDRPSPPDRQGVFRAFRQGALEVLRTLGRPCLLEELVSAVFALPAAGDWVREGDQVIPGCASPEEFQRACALPGAESAVDCAATILGRTADIRRYDRHTVGLADWPDDRHLLYYWPQMEACAATGRERELARCAAEIGQMVLPSPLRERAEAAMPVYRRMVATVAAG